VQGVVDLLEKEVNKSSRFFSSCFMAGMFMRFFWTQRVGFIYRLMEEVFFVKYNRIFEYRQKGEIINIVEKEHIADIVPLISKESWLLVDCDNTLFEGAEAYGHAHWFYDRIQENMDRGMTKDEAIRVFYPEWVKAQKFCKVKPIEEDFPVNLRDLQKQGIKVMGLTHRQPKIADSTFRQVNSLSIDFQLTAPSEQTFVVPSDHPTLYKRGILFVGDYNQKGEIFASFLERIQDKPKQIVFIDDKRGNLEEMEKMAKSLGIKFLGIHYTAIQYAKPVYSREVAELGFQLLDA